MSTRCSRCEYEWGPGEATLGVRCPMCGQHLYEDPPEDSRLWRE